MLVGPDGSGKTDIPEITNVQNDPYIKKLATSIAGLEKITNLEK
jgi:hypothetical protein